MESHTSCVSQICAVSSPGTPCVEPTGEARQTLAVHALPPPSITRRAAAERGLTLATSRILGF